jgi:hypothetical protein
MYVCMYVCIYVCMYVRTYVRMYVCIYALSMHVCMYVCNMYVINKLHFYFLFVSQKSICHGLPVFVNYLRFPSSPFPQIIDSTLYIHFVRNNRRYESLLWTQLYTHNLSVEIAVTTSKDNDACNERDIIPGQQ